MKSNHGIRYLITLVALVAAAGCAAGPEENEMLEQARAAYNAARSDPAVMENAEMELAEAEEQLATAQELWEEDAEKARVEHHAYLSRQQTEIARETAQFAKAQQAISDADAERARVLMEVRAREAEAARREADIAQRELEEARRRAEEQARTERTRELEEARERAEEQARMAEARMQELEEERQRAEEARRQAEMAGQKAAGLEQELAELKARPTERGMVLTLGDVLFDLDKADLNPGANLVMDRLAAFLKDHEERRILVEGFTDSTGPEDYNRQLSERRAQSVRQALMGRGISGERIEVRGYGEQYPVATNETVAGRQQNRRVEIIFSDEAGELPGRR